MKYKIKRLKRLVNNLYINNIKKPTPTYSYMRLGDKYIVFK